MNAAQHFGIGALSERTGVKIETIRYYERESLLPSPPRTSGGHRSYGEDHLKRLTFIRRSRELGFSMAEIRELLALVDGGSYTCGEVQALTLDHAESVRKKVADLRRMEKTLRNISSQCDGGSIPECPIIEVLFELDGHGASD
jgi:MerR family mercuric resistance operon transcriptional regulator